MTMEQRGTLRLSTKWGSIIADGPLMMLLVVIVLGFSILSYLIWQHDKERAAQMSSVQIHNAALVEAMAEMTYISSLTQEERKLLRIGMPDSLRAKLRRGDQ